MNRRDFCKTIAVGAAVPGTLSRLAPSALTPGVTDAVGASTPRRGMSSNPMFNGTDGIYNSQPACLMPWDGVIYCCKGPTQIR